jgi:hypothetical protein
VILWATPALSKDLCALYRNVTPLPDWYSKYCNRPGGSSTKDILGAFSSFADAFNLNPSSIPTFELPVGVEYISSFKPGLSRNNFALIKGFDRIGAALSSNSDETFFSDSSNATSTLTSGGYLDALSPSANVPTLSLGTALGIMLPKFLEKVASAKLGAMLRLNKDTGSLSPGGGLAIFVGPVNAGISVIGDPKTTVSGSNSAYMTYNLGVELGVGQLEYVRIQRSSLSGFSTAPVSAPRPTAFRLTTSFRSRRRHSSWRSLRLWPDSFSRAP